MKRQHLFRLWIASAGLLLMTPLLWADGGENGASKIGYELIGQVLNLSPQQSLQYGYLNNVAGLDRISINPGLISESTAAAGRARLYTLFGAQPCEEVTLHVRQDSTLANVCRRCFGCFLCHRRSGECRNQAKMNMQSA